MQALYLCDKPAGLTRVYPEALRKRLSADFTFPLSSAILTHADLEENKTTLAEIEAIFSTWGMPSLTEEEIAAYFPRLRHVFYAAGSVQAFARPFLARGISVHSAWAANAVPVAEYAVSVILLSNKGFFGTLRQPDRKAARRYADAMPGNYGCRVGLIGVGMIGSLVAQMLRQYHIEVAAYDPFLPAGRADELGLTMVSLDELFAASQVISNHLANNAQTKGMLNYPLFSRMLPNATFLNTGRGAQVVEEDLVRALREEPGRTAILDVTYPEPCASDHPFHSLPNVVLTPHIAGSKGDEVVRMAEYMADEAERILAGSPPSWSVSEKMLETMA